MQHFNTLLIIENDVTLGVHIDIISFPGLMSAEMTAVTLCSHNLTFIKYHVIALRFLILTKYALS